MSFIDSMIHYLSYPFVVNALIVGVLIAFCSSLLGATLVLKRLSYIGDGLSHIAFGVIAVASVLDIVNADVLVFPVTAIVAILLLRMSNNSKIKGDSAIAMLSVSSLAIGYLLMNIFSVSSNLAADVCITLFGSTSILTLTQSDVITCFVLSIFVLIMFIFFYNKIFAITFDETFAKASGIKVQLFNVLIATTISAIIVVAMNLVGSLLISALIIFPALSSMRFSKSYRQVIAFSAIISITCALLGMCLSIVYGTPVGSTIVSANVLIFVVCVLIFRKR